MFPIVRPRDSRIARPRIAPICPPSASPSGLSPSISSSPLRSVDQFVDVDVIGDLLGIDPLCE